MRNIQLLIIGLVLCSSLFAQKSYQPLTITPLTGNFYIYTTYNLYKGEPVPANSMYLVTDSGVVMMDTPWDSTQNQPLLDSIERKHHKKVVLCIATHSHADRTGGLSFLNQHGVKTYTSKQTDDICIATNEHRPGYIFLKDTVFKVGQYTFNTCYAGEGHTPDNIVVWFPKDKVLYGGCLIKSTETTDLGYTGNANVKAWPNTIKKLQQKYPERVFVIPGHESWASKLSLEHTLKLLKENNKN